MAITDTEHDMLIERVTAAETWQSYFPDHADDETHPTPGIDPLHTHFIDYLDSHPGEST